MDLQLKGAGVVIVGGANGIGKAIAEAFASEGASIGILDQKESARNIAGSIGDTYNVPQIGVPVDATDYDGVREAAGAVVSHLGNLRHVVYAAGMGSGKFGFPFWNLDPGDWQQVINVNLIGAVNTAHAFVPYLIRQPDGSVLFISSIAGQIGSQTDPPYSAAKAALINFAMCAAKDLAPFKIRVNTICPGMIRTDLNRAVWQAWNDCQAEMDRLGYEEWGQSKVKQVAPMGRWQEPEEIAALAAYLASHCAANITGQTLNVDGGQVMHW